MTANEFIAKLQEIVKDTARPGFDYCISCLRVKDVLKMLDRLKEQNEQLQATLRPFAKYAASLTGPNWLPDACPVTVDPAEISSSYKTEQLTVKHLRKALEVIQLYDGG